MKILLFCIGFWLISFWMGLIFGKVFCSPPTPIDFPEELGKGATLQHPDTCVVYMKAGNDTTFFEYLKH